MSERTVGGKFKGPMSRRTAQSVNSLRHPETAYIIDGQQGPEVNKVQQ